jgi:hypothetical protein
MLSKQFWIGFAIGDGIVMGLAFLSFMIYKARTANASR